VESVPESQGFDEGHNHTLKVTTVYKGEKTEQITIFSENTSGRFPMEIGKSYLLFVHEYEKRLQIDNCGNSGLASKKSEEIKQLHNLDPIFVSCEPNEPVDLQQNSSGRFLPTSEPEMARYKKSYEAFCWNCIMVKSGNLEARCPFTCSGTPGATNGCAEGATYAENKLLGLIKTHGAEKVKVYLQTGYPLRWP